MKKYKNISKLDLILISLLCFFTISCLIKIINRDDLEKNDEVVFQPAYGDKIILDVKQKIQENDYYCSPASVQMALNYYGIEVSQDVLAKEMNTEYLTGTDYKDMTKVLNNYLYNTFSYDPKGDGYHIHSIEGKYDYEKEEELFRRRILKDISSNKIVFLNVRIQALYDGYNDVSHSVILVGYKFDKENNQMFYYIMDPYGKVQDDIYEGLKIISEEEIMRSIITNLEPAYIW